MEKKVIKKTWKQLHHADFDHPGITPGVYDAIKEIRKAAKTFIDSATTSEVFYFCADDVLGKAIWSDVGNVIAAFGGPDLPDTISCEWDGKEHTLSLSWKTIAGHLASASDFSGEQEWLLGTVANCFYARCKLVRERLLLQPKDWWLRLALNDVSSAINKLYDEQEPNTEDG